VEGRLSLGPGARDGRGRRAARLCRVNGQEAAAEAAAVIAEQTGADRHEVALVLGSGWAGSVDRLGVVRAELPTADVPGFAASAVTGHAGRIRSLDVDGHRVLVLLGRTHLYEHRDAAAVAHPVRVAAACGCSAVILTNACGGIRESLRPGDLVVIADHLNLTAVSPLEGATFVDLSDLYSTRLRALCRTVDPSLPEGVYAGYWGPNYETPAEIRAYRILGADMVGMSTVLEAIAARAAGLEVLGLALVTNMAAGIAGPLSHEEVLAQGRAGEQRAGDLLAGVLAAMLRG
jgi:purine-nucleoside phosphorylase